MIKYIIFLFLLAPSVCFATDFELTSANKPAGGITNTVPFALQNGDTIIISDDDTPDEVIMVGVTRTNITIYAPQGLVVKE